MKDKMLSARKVIIVLFILLLVLVLILYRLSLNSEPSLEIKHEEVKSLEIKSPAPVATQTDVVEQKMPEVSETSSPTTTLLEPEQRPLEPPRPPRNFGRMRIDRE